MKMIETVKTIAVTPADCNCNYFGSQIELRRYADGGYNSGVLELRVHYFDADGPSRFRSMSETDAMRLRDTLLELYPIEVTKSKKTCPVGWPGCDGNCLSGPSPAPTVAIYPLPASIEGDPSKWEVVADGIDRIAVPGGWIYQNVEGQMLFVADAACKS